MAHYNYKLTQITLPIHPVPHDTSLVVPAAPLAATDDEEAGHSSVGGPSFAPTLGFSFFGQTSHPTVPFGT